MKTEYEGLTCETVSDAAGRRAEASLVPTVEEREMDAKDLPEIQSEIRFIGDMQRLQVKPGDVFVLNVADEITDETAERLRKHLLRALGDEAKVLVLDQRLTLGVIGSERADPWGYGWGYTPPAASGGREKGGPVEAGNVMDGPSINPSPKTAGGYASLVELGQSK